MKPSRTASTPITLGSPKAQVAAFSDRRDLVRGSFTSKECQTHFTGTLYWLSGSSWVMFDCSSELSYYLWAPDASAYKKLGADKIGPPVPRKDRSHLDFCSYSNDEL